MDKLQNHYEHVIKSNILSDMNETKKSNQFVEWLCGEKVDFPYFKSKVRIDLPKGYPFTDEECERKTEDINSQEIDYGEKT